MINRITAYLWPHRRQWLVHLSLTVLVSGLQLLTPWPIKIIVDNVVGDIPLPMSITSVVADNKYYLLLIVVVLGFALAILINALNLWTAKISIQRRQAIVWQLKGDLFNSLQNQTLKYHNDRRLGDTIYRVNNDVWGIDELILTILPVCVAVITLIGMFSVVAYMNWQMALISMCVLPLFYSTYVLYSKSFGQRVEEVQRLEGESISIVQEVLSALPVVKSFTRERDEHTRFMRQGNSAKEARVKLTTQQATYSLLVGLLTTLGTSLVLGFGAYQILLGALTLGELLVILAYLSAVYSPLESIYTAITYIHGYLAKINRVFEVLDAEPETIDHPHARKITKLQGAVSFENVKFDYGDGRDVLNEINFRIEPGQLVGLVGPTGAGKTSLLSLIPRFYEPLEGKITIDSYDVRDIELESLRRNIGIVLQEPILLAGTIRENISYANPNANEEEIIAASRAANAHDFIGRLPDGYDTVVGERGVKLSGGERQRITIARAFLKDAPILILDEPTSSVDYKTEAAIFSALERLMFGRTTFMIAHRISSVVHADKIIVLQDGRIVQTGTHDQLLKTTGLYHDLYSMAAVASGASETVTQILHTGSP